MNAPTDPFRGVADALRDTGRLLAAFAPPRPPLHTSRMAITAVVLAAVGLGPVGLVFALCGLADVREKRTTGRRLAVFAVVLNAINCVGWIVTVALIVQGSYR